MSLCYKDKCSYKVEAEVCKMLYTMLIWSANILVLLESLNNTIEFVCELYDGYAKNKL